MQQTSITSRIIGKRNKIKDKLELKYAHNKLNHYNPKKFKTILNNYFKNYLF